MKLGEHTKDNLKLGEHTGDNLSGEHYFNYGLAIDIGGARGIPAAIVFSHIAHTVKYHLSEKHTDENGVSWAIISVNGISQILPELKRDRINDLVELLIESGLVIKKSSNRRNSYTLTELGWKYINRTKEEGKPKIPTSEQVKQKKETQASAEVFEVIEYLNREIGRKRNPNTKSARQGIENWLSEGYTVTDMKAVIDVMKSKWFNTEYKCRLRPETLFGDKFESYYEQAQDAGHVANKTAQATTKRTNNSVTADTHSLYYEMVRFGCIDNNKMVNKDKYVTEVRGQLTPEEQVIVDSWYEKEE